MTGLLIVGRSQANFVYLPMGVQAAEPAVRRVAVRSVRRRRLRVTVGHPDAETAVLAAMRSKPVC